MDMNNRKAESKADAKLAEIAMEVSTATVRIGFNSGTSLTTFVRISQDLHHRTIVRIGDLR